MPPTWAAPYRHHYRRLAAGSEAGVSLGGKLDAIFLNELRIPSQRLAVIPNAIDDGYIEPQLEPRTRRQPRELLFIGRLTRNKGAGLLIDAFNDLVGCAVGLTLVGQGPQERELRWRCRNPRVRFVGKVNDQELFSLLSDERRTALATAARALVLKHFTWPAVARATLELAERVMELGALAR